MQITARSRIRWFVPFQCRKTRRAFNPHESLVGHLPIEVGLLLLLIAVVVIIVVGSADT